MKKHLPLLFLILISSGSVFAQLPSNVPSKGLQAYWGFDGNSNDLSNNSNTLTNNGATLTTDRDGNTNSAYDYDGTNDYMIVNSPSFSFGQTDSFSVSWWMYKTVAEYGIALMQSSGASGNFIWIFQTNAVGDMSHGAGKQNSGWTWAKSSYKLNVWEHYVATYANGAMNLYKDGVFVTSSTFGYTGSAKTSLPFRIGRSHAGNYYDGKIDDVGIWDRVLTQNEINGLYLGCNLVDNGPKDFFSTNGGAWFDVDADASGVTYQWQSDSSGSFQDLTNGGIYSGVTTDSLVLTSATATYNSVNYRCVVSDTTCSDTSEFAMLTICGDIIGQPKDQLIAPNTSAVFGVQSNDPMASFQWQIKDPSGWSNVSGSTYTGAKSDTLTLLNALWLYNGKEYRCLVHDGQCKDTSDVALLTISNNISLVEEKGTEISVYPNPAKDMIHVEVSKDLLGASYDLYNHMGQEVRKGEITSELIQLNVSELQDGQYIIIIEDRHYAIQILK